MAQLKGTEYGDRLGELYEPAAEGQMMQLAFAARYKVQKKLILTKGKVWILKLCG